MKHHTIRFSDKQRNIVFRDGVDDVLELVLADDALALLALEGLHIQGGTGGVVASEEASADREKHEPEQARPGRRLRRRQQRAELGLHGLAGPSIERST